MNNFALDILFHFRGNASSFPLVKELLRDGRNLGCPSLRSKASASAAMPGLRRPRLSAAGCLAALCGMSAAHTTTLASSATTLAALPTITSTASAPPPPLPPGTTPAPEICESRSTVFPVLMLMLLTLPVWGQNAKVKATVQIIPQFVMARG